MKKTKTQRLLLKIFSGLIAIALWFAITYTEDPLVYQHLNDLNVEFIGEDTLKDDAGLIIVNKESLPPISALFQGNRSKVISSLGSITAQLDVSQIKSEGESIINVSYSYPTNMVTFVHSNTKTVTVTAEKIVSRTIPLRIEVENAEKNATHLIEPNCSVSTIKIKGGQTAAYNISYARAVVDATDMTSNDSRKYSYEFYDEDDNVLPKDNIVYVNRNTVTVNTTVYKRISVPIKVILPDNLKADFGLDIRNISPSSVTVGYLDQPPTELTATFDKDKKAENGTYTLKVNASDGIYLPAKSQTVTVSAELAPKKLTELEIPVQIENNTTSKVITLDPVKVTVSAKGIDGEVTTSKIHASINVGDLPTGTTLVPVKVTADNDTEIIGSYTTSVTVK